MEREKQIEEFYKNLEGVMVTCGGLVEMEGKKFVGSCGGPIQIMKVYACVDCSAPFHRKCLLKHFHYDMPTTSLTKMPLDEALARVDELESNASGSEATAPKTL